MNTLDLPYQRRIRPPQVNVRAPADRAAKTRVWIAAALLYLLLLPNQFNPTIAEVYLSPFRIFLLVGSLYLLADIARQNLRFVLPDLLIVVAMAWIFLASYMSSGSLGTSLIMGGSHTVDIGLAYFLARSTIRTPTDLRRFLVLIAPGIGFVGGIVALESVSHTLIVQRLAGAITGMPIPPILEVRMGLMRGMGPFPHPILAGIFLGSFLPIYALSSLRGWPRILGVFSSVGGVLSMSSAAMLAVVVGGILIVYDWLSERIRNLSWQMFLLFAGILYITVELVSKSGFYSILIRYASLNTATAYNRVLIWEFGTENIEKNPWFGIGYSDWDRPDWMHSGSFDHFWLIMALRFGIPTSFLLLGATLSGIISAALATRRLPGKDARLLRGIAISLAVFALGVNSVSLWMTTLAWFFMLLGIAVSLGSAQALPQPPRPSPTSPILARALLPGAARRAPGRP